MKNLFLICACAVILLSVNCQKDDIKNTPTQDYFEFIVDDNFTSDIKTWIILNSENGDTIKSQEIFNNNTYRFDLPEYSGSEKYTVQLVSGTSQDQYLEIYCFLDVKPQTWQLNGYKYPKTENLSRIGIETIEFDEELMAPTGFGYYFAFYSIRNKYTQTYSMVNNSTVQLEQYYNPDNIYIALGKGYNQAPLFKWFDKVELNATYSLSRKDFTVVTDSMDISFPTNISCNALIESEDNPSTDFLEYYKVFKGIYSDTNLAKVYYPRDIFPGFWSQLFIQTESTYEYYTKRSGNIPSTFKQMDANIQINNKLLMHFNATASGNADFCQLSWGLRSDNGYQTFRYNVFGSLNSINHFYSPKIPDYLIDTLQINLANLDYPYISLYEYDNYSGFEDYIQNRFVQPGELGKGVNEYQSKEIYNSGLKSSKTGKEELEMMDKERQWEY